ncbi:MAG TPA: vitamin K epoxide reductase family protein [Candidatus Paceibacterota bacterium]|nr:vitamin K epoxide reductase family protein [Candidatus Paceibacterota bacterium]
MTTRTGLLFALLVLAALGIIDAWYLTLSAFQGAALVCDIGAALDGCNIVAQSPYSKLFGLPLALYGVAFYGLVFALVAALFIATHHPLYQAAVVLGVLGLVASLGFLFIQFVLIKALCIYCVFSAVIAALICILSFVLFRKHAPGRQAAPMVS